MLGILGIDMVRCAMTWLLCLLLAVTLVTPANLMAAGHHAGGPCVAEIEPREVASHVQGQEKTDPGAPGCCTPCGHCAAMRLEPNRLASLSAEPRFERVSRWPRAPNQRLDRPPRV